MYNKIKKYIKSYQNDFKTKKTYKQITIFNNYKIELTLIIRES